MNIREQRAAARVFAAKWAGRGYELGKALDKAVEQAYGVDFKSDEQQIAAHLFKLHSQAAGS